MTRSRGTDLHVINPAQNVAITGLHRCERNHIGADTFNLIMGLADPDILMECHSSLIRKFPRYQALKGNQYFIS